MKNKNELSFKDLKMTCNPNIFDFNTTEELEPIRTGIGQDRGISALEFGIQIDVNFSFTGFFFLNTVITGSTIAVGNTLYTSTILHIVLLSNKNFLNLLAPNSNVKNVLGVIYPRYPLSFKILIPNSKNVLYVS